MSHRMRARSNPPLPSLVRPSCCVPAAADVDDADDDGDDVVVGHQASATPTSRGLLFPLREDTDAAQENRDQPSVVLPFLLLGNSIHGCSRHLLEENEVTHVLCVEEFFRRAMPGLTHMHVPMSDAGNTELSDILPGCLDFIEEARLSGGRVLCHCFAGINRSPTVCLAYMIKVQKMTLQDAWCQIKTRRSIVSPCLRYRRQLIDYEETILGSSSMTLESWANWGHESCKKRVADQLRRKLVGITVTASLLPPIASATAPSSAISSSQQQQQRSPGSRPGSRPPSGSSPPTLLSPGGFEVVGRLSAASQQVAVRVKTWPTVSSATSISSITQP